MTIASFWILVMMQQKSGRRLGLVLVQRGTADHRRHKVRRVKDNIAVTERVDVFANADERDKEDPMGEGEDEV